MRHRRTVQKGRASRGKGNVAGLRLMDAQRIFSRASGATYNEVMRELTLSRATLNRYVEILASQGVRLEEIGERDGGKVRRVIGQGRQHASQFTLEEIVFLKVLELTTSAFRGTGIDDAIGRVFSKMEATLRPRERAKILDLHRKILDVPDHVHDYSGKIEVLDQIMTALLEEQPVVIKHASKKAERRQFRIDPYTLVTHKRALYLVGFSHHHKAVRTFSIDGIVDATRRTGASFAYPKEWNPAKLFEGAFGIIPGEETEVTLRFDASVEAWLRARIWHPTQSLRKKGRFLYLTMRPRGTTEVLSWALGWGEKVAVISPPSLRSEWARQAETMARMAREIAEAEEKKLGEDGDEDDMPS